MNNARHCRIQQNLGLFIRIRIWGIKVHCDYDTLKVVTIVYKWDLKKKGGGGKYIGNIIKNDI